MHRTLFDPHEIPADLRQYFEEVEVSCGAPWTRVVERRSHSLPVAERQGRVSHNGSPPQQSGWFWTPPDVTERGWAPTCKCPPHEPIPAVCLDPFAGAGTTGLTAQRLSRDAILIELNPQYCEIIEKRLEADRLARDPILREQAAARAGGWTAPTLPLWQPQGGDDD